MHKTLSGVFECRRAACGKSAAPIARTALKKRPRRAKPGDNPEYRTWLVKNCKCVVCAKWEAQQRFASEWRLFVEPDFSTIDPAHTTHKGMALKGDDSTCAPLCRFHHNEYDGRLTVKVSSHEAFEKKYGVDMQAEAKTHFAAFLLVGKE